MNEDHAVSVYAMVLSTLSKSKSNRNNNNITISKCLLTNVTPTKITLSYVECDDNVKGGICMPKELDIDFNPPLTSSAEIR